MITLLAVLAAIGWLTCAYGWHRAAVLGLDSTPEAPAPPPRYTPGSERIAMPRCRCTTEPIGRTTTDDGGRW